MRIAALLALVLVVLRPARADQQATPPAAGEDATRPWAVGVPPEKQEEALRLFKEGNDAFEQGRYAQALSAYRNAVSFWNHPGIQFNMAVTLIQLDQWLPAYESLMQALRYGDAAVVAYGVSNGCGINVCFSSTTPMQHMATLTLPTSAGPQAVALADTVLAPAAGLDTSFGGTGAITTNTNPDRWTEALLGDGATVALWNRTYSPGFTEFSPAGVATMKPLGAIQFDTGVTMRKLRAQSGHGIYADVGDTSSCLDALIHFADDGTRDTSFGEVQFPTADFYCDTAIELQSSGRVLVLGDSSAIAYSPTGTTDTSYGVGGVGHWPWQTYGEILRASASPTAIDTQDRLYVATMSGVARLQAGGTLDSGFSFLGPVGAITLDGNQHLLVAAAGGVARLDDSGAATMLPLASAPGLSSAMNDIDLDAAGRLYLTTSTGNVLRFLADGSFDATVGFEGAHQVVCAANGSCTIVGSTPLESYVLRFAP